MELVATPQALFSATPFLAMMWIASRRLTFGALSLPGFTAYTSLFYFYFMPMLALDDGSSHLGMHITTLVWTHVAVGLYGLGALIAFALNRKTLERDPLADDDGGVMFNNFRYNALWLVTVPACMIAIVRFNIALNYEGPNEDSAQFLTLFFSILISLTVMYVAKTGFKVRSFAVLSAVTLLMLQVGFRYRLVILFSAVLLLWALRRNLRIGVFAIALVTFIAIPSFNVIGLARKYGQGLDLDSLKDLSYQDAFSEFGGEIGVVYALYFLTETPLPPLIGLEPYTVALARFIPRFLWADKPDPEYLAYAAAGFTAEGADKAGVAPPQQFEMLLQFGWIGLPILSLLYFSAACLLARSMLRLTTPARLAGLTMIPAFFGFYMQTRGYFFQILADALAFFLPIFLVDKGETRNLNDISTHPSQVRS